MKKTLGGIFKVLGYIAYAVFGLWSFVLNLSILNRVVGGFWIFVVAIGLFPVTLVAVPWYALIALRDWFPLVITYGGGIVATILVLIGTAIAGEDEDVYRSKVPDITGDEIQSSPTPKKYVKWYSIVLIILLILNALESMIEYGYLPIESMIWFLFFIIIIIGIAIKRKWGSVLAMINAAYSILSGIIFCAQIITGQLNQENAILSPSLGWVLAIVLFSLFIFTFIIALKEYKQL